MNVYNHMVRRLLRQPRLIKTNNQRMFQSSFFCFSIIKQIGIANILKKYADQLEKSKILETMMPRVYNQKFLQTIIKNQRFSQNNNHIEALNLSLGKPIWDLLDRGGKRWRPTLCMLIAELYNKPRSSVLEISAFIELVHNGSLILDDIEDDSQYRRGKECVHLLYGVDTSINAGSFMYCAPMIAILESSNYSPEMKNTFMNVYIREITNIHLGQAWDISWHNIDKLQGSYPTENHYMEMSAQKTGALARLAVKLVCIFVQAPLKQQQILCQVIQNLSVAFQIQDDILNLESEGMKQTKGYKGEDIHQGKMSLMVIHHLNNSPPTHKGRLLEILKMKTQDPKLIEEAILLLKQTNSITYAQERMNKLIEEAKESLTSNFKSSQTLELFLALMDLGIKRNK